VKILLVTFSDNADHQDTLFGLYENLKDVYNTYLLAITAPKVPIEKSEHTWFVDCPKRPGIEKRTFNIFLLVSIIYRIKKEKFDAIYFESLHVWNLPILMTAGKTVHTYQVIHEVIPHEGDSQVKGVDLINKVICRTTKTIILRNQKYIQNLIDQYNVDPDRIRFLELWRRYPDFTEPVYKKRVLFFGRINPYKGANNLLEIVRLCPDIQFDIVGRVDPLMMTVVEMLKTERNVRLHNSYVSDDEMRKAFTNCDWVIVPYNSASQSGIIIDAYKYSRPVIAFNVGAIAEQVDDGKSGYLVSAGDNGAFADKLKEAVKMPIEIYHAMCASAYQYGSKKYAASGAVKRFIRLIEGEK
jgi:glycosyltransferase involved in cell wall biosynthesis